MNARLPDDLRFGGIALAVADLERSIDYYRRRLGIEVLEQEGGGVAPGSGGRRPPFDPVRRPTGSGVAVDALDRGTRRAPLARR